ncbi:hypothetical protein Tco_1370849 [Tanacetum coccineum]
MQNIMQKVTIKISNDEARVDGSRLTAETANRLLQDMVQEGLEKDEVILTNLIGKCKSSIRLCGQSPVTREMKHQHFRQLPAGIDKHPGPVMNMDDLSKALQEAILHIDASNWKIVEFSVIRLDRENIRVILFSIHSDDGNPSSANIKQALRVQDEAFQGRLFDSFQDEVKYKYVGPKVTRSQEGERFKMMKR